MNIKLNLKYDDLTPEEVEKISFLLTYDHKPFTPANVEELLLELFEYTLIHNPEELEFVTDKSMSGVIKHILDHEHYGLEGALYIENVEQ